MVELPGVHRVRVKIAGGRAEYWYAWRGGPCILKAAGTTDGALALQVRRGAHSAQLAYANLTASKGGPEGFLATLIDEWISSPEFKKLAERTQRDMRKWLAVVSADLGDLEVKALKATGARNTLLTWRNRYQKTPRTADHLLSAVAQVLKWARDNGKTDADPLQDWPRLYSVDRSHVIWTPAEIERICLHAEPELQRAVLLAAYTGLRQGDLLRLTWADIGDATITRKTRKRGRTVHIPIVPELRTVLDACPKGDWLQVLTKDGAPWRVSTLEKRFSIARAKAGIVGKRWHDFRGTYATLLARSGIEISSIAQIMGWNKETAEDVISLYVSGEAVALAAVERLKRFTAGAGSSTISRTE